MQNLCCVQRGSTVGCIKQAGILRDHVSLHRLLSLSISYQCQLSFQKSILNVSTELGGRDIIDHDRPFAQV